MSLFYLFFWGVPIVALISYIFLLIFIMISRKDRPMKAFALVLISLIVWTGSSLLMKMNISPSPLFWNKIMLTGAFMASLFMYIFIGAFTNTRDVGRTAIWSLVTVFAITVNLFGLVVTSAEMETAGVFSISSGIYEAPRFIYELGPGTVPIYICLFMLCFAILGKIYLCVKRGIVSFDRVKLIAAGVLFIFVGFLPNLFPEIGRYPFDLLGGFINAILLMVAIFRTRIFQMKFIMTRGLIFSFFAFLLTGLYIYAVLFVEKFIQPTNSTTFSIISAIIALVAAFAFQPLFGASFKVANKLFYKSEYDQRLALKNFSLHISSNINLNEISVQLLDAVERAIRAKRSCLLLKNKVDKNYFVSRTTSQLNTMDITIRLDSPIVKWLTDNDTCLVSEDLNNYPQFKSLWTSERRMLSNFDVNVIVPLKCRDELIGMLVLSEKDNNTSYTLEDIDLLTSFGASAATAIDNARLYKRAQEEAVTDSLTGLFNHRYLYQCLENHMETSPGKTLSLIILNIDLFKLYNDIYGHFEGDEALKQVADMICSNVGQHGVCVRYGGDEFVIVLPDYDSYKAYDIAEKIRKEVQRRSVENITGVKRFMTISAGICTYPFAAPNQNELLKRTEIALFKTKSSGKNRTTIYTPDTDSGRVSETQSNVREGGGVTGVKSYSATLYALTAAIDTKDHYTFSHSQKVTQYTAALAAEIGMDHSHVEILTEAALLHDIGKIGIPEHILAKRGPLTNEEFAIMKNHVDMSITIVKHLPTLNYVIPTIIGHHERWDGTGYPRGIKGEEIDIGARCLAIADSFDAIVSYRPYKTVMSVEHALREIEKNSGTQFDPNIANVFVRMVRSGQIRIETDMTITENGMITA